jgi:hypothetical protein
MGAQALSARGHLGSAIRRHGADSPAAIEARTELAAANIADYIARTLADAPPLSPAQRARLRDVLRGAGESNGSA